MSKGKEYNGLIQYCKKAAENYSLNPLPFGIPTYKKNAISAAFAVPWDHQYNVEQGQNISKYITILYQNIHL